MTIFYKFDGQMYINITNGCPCDCVFCLRNNSDSVKGNDSLWLEHEPSFEEITAAFDKFDKTAAPMRYSADTVSRQYGRTCWLGRQSISARIRT